MTQIASENINIPRSVLIGAGVLMLLAIAVAGASHATGANHIRLPPASVVESRDLLFKDLSDGGIAITDAKTRSAVATIQPTTGGFMRGVMRGLVRVHRIDELAAGTSFRLTRWSDGRLSIEDPLDGERFELEAFGPTNEGAFARLLTSQTAEVDRPSSAAR